MTIRDGNDPDQCRRLTLFDAFQVVVNDKNVPFFNLISHHIALISFPLLMKFKSTYLNCLSRLQFDWYFKIVWPNISSPTLVDFVRIVLTIQGCCKVWKSGGASSNQVGITCPPLVEIGLTDLPKSGCAMAPPAPPGNTPAIYLANPKGCHNYLGERKILWIR